MSATEIPDWFQRFSFSIGIKGPCGLSDGNTLMSFCMDKKEYDRVMIHYAVNFDYTIGLAHNPGVSDYVPVPSEYFINCDREGFANYIAKKYEHFDVTVQDIFDHPEIVALFMLLEEERARSE